MANNKYRALRPGDYGVCVLNYGVRKRQVFTQLDRSHYADVGIATSCVTSVLVVAIILDGLTPRTQVVLSGAAQSVQVVLPDGAVGWLRLGNCAAYVDFPGKLAGRDLYVVSPKLKVSSEQDRVMAVRNIAAIPSLEAGAMSGLYRDLQPGDYGVCVLARGVFRQIVYKSNRNSCFDEVGLVYSSETPVLVITSAHIANIDASPEAHNVQVVLPNGRVGWLCCRNRAVYVDLPGRLVDCCDLHVISPKLKVVKVDSNNMITTWA